MIKLFNDKRIKRECQTNTQISNAHPAEKKATTKQTPI